eukprot:g6825.t1
MNNIVKVYGPREPLGQIAFNLEEPIFDVAVLILDRPKHDNLMQQCREAGARIRLISDGNVSGSIEVAKAGAPVNVSMGIGASPVGVIAACALKCMGMILKFTDELWKL